MHRFSNLLNKSDATVSLSQLNPFQRMLNGRFNACVCNVKDNLLVPHKLKNEIKAKTNALLKRQVNQVPKRTRSNDKYNHITCNSFEDNCNYHPFYSLGFNRSSRSLNFRVSLILNRCLSNRHFYGRKYYRRTLNNNSPERIMSFRTWENASDLSVSQPGFIFTLMSYNVLAQDLLEQHPYIYKYHDAASLNWKQRWSNLYREITKFSPDILCLQEVQESHLGNYSLLNALGYESVYKKRTGSQTDGCAIYYKSGNVSLIEYNFVEYFKPTVSILNRDNVGIVVKFAPKMHPSREFVVATTHLLYNPKRDDVRMAQMQLLLAEIEKMSYKNDDKVPSYLPVILTGDLNSTPDSDLYQFISTGTMKFEYLSPRLLETRPNSGRETLVTEPLGITDNCQFNVHLENRRINSCASEKVETETNDKAKENERSCKNKAKLTHNFNFKSVYDHGTRENNEATTHQYEWLTVDYIFYSKKKGTMHPRDKLKLLAKYRLPRNKELCNTTIPNRVLGSDHLSLISKFKLEF